MKIAWVNHMFVPLENARPALGLGFAITESRGVRAAEGFTVPHFTDPTPVPVENELLFWSDCTILRNCNMIWSAVLFALHHFHSIPTRPCPV